MRVNDLIRKWENVDINQVADEAFNAAKEEYADLNAEQMYEGRDSLGDEIRLDGRRGYAYRTILDKQKKGQVTDRVTLRDTGAFYRGLYARKEGNKVYSGSRDEKADKIQERSGAMIFGLSEEKKKMFSTGVYKREYLRIMKDLFR